MDLTVDEIITVAQRMMYLTCMLSLPVLITALGVGVLISLFQTVTGVQEMTITFVPKLLAVIAVIAFALPWSVQVMTEYTVELWSNF